jgi:hypothetical protein
VSVPSTGPSPTAWGTMPGGRSVAMIRGVTIGGPAGGARRGEGGGVVAYPNDLNVETPGTQTRYSPYSSGLKIWAPQLIVVQNGSSGVGPQLGRETWRTPLLEAHTPAHSSSRTAF